MNRGTVMALFLFLVGLFVVGGVLTSFLRMKNHLPAGTSGLPGNWNCTYPPRGEPICVRSSMGFARPPEVTP